MRPPALVPRSSPRRRVALALLGLLVLAGIAAAIVLIQGRSAPAPGVTGSTSWMVQTLREIRARELADATIHETDSAASNPWFVNRPQTIPTYREAVNRTTDPARRVPLQIQLVRELLWDGRNQEALAELAQLRALAGKEAARHDPASVARLLGLVRDHEAIAHLRIGELANCVRCETGASCIFPIGSEGVHRAQQGSREAVRLLGESLRLNPGDLGARWLINVAAMTLGEHPDGLPKEWVLPSTLFAAEANFPRFPNVARERGVDVFGLAGGSVLEDFDGDGDLDLVASAWSLDEQLRYFRNRGDGFFDERTREAGLEGITGGLNLSHADYDNDGNADLLVIRGGWLGDRGSYPPSLLKNLGGGAFVDVTRESGLLTFHPGQVGVWSDFDNDGWLDLFLGREDDGKGRHPCELFHNNRDGTFTDWAPRLGLANLGFVKGAAWGDYDNDGLQDLHVSRLGLPNVLFHNEGAVPDGWKFADVSVKAGITEPNLSFATWWFDFDNDGWLDLFTAGFNRITPGDIAAQYLGQPHSGEVPRLYRNHRDGTFTDVTHDAKLDRVSSVMAANFGDLDADGYPDLYLGTGGPDFWLLMPNRAFRNREGKRFEDITTAGGFGHLQKGHGISFGDIDGDGDLDVYAVLGGWYSADGFQNALFLNPGFGRHWLKLRLEGKRSNRSALGARIHVTLPPGGPVRDLHATVSSGGSFGSSTLEQTIGLGTATEVESVEVTWPATGKTQRLGKLRVDRQALVREE